MCLLPFLFRNDLNSLLTKLDPLSDTKISGRPCEAKVVLSFSMVVLDLADFTHAMDVHPFRMCINDHEKHLPRKRTHMIYVYLRSGTVWPFPRV